MRLSLSIARYTQKRFENGMICSTKLFVAKSSTALSKTVLFIFFLIYQFRSLEFQNRLGVPGVCLLVNSFKCYFMLFHCCFFELIHFIRRSKAGEKKIIWEVNERVGKSTWACNALSSFDIRGKIHTFILTWTTDGALHCSLVYLIFYWNIN